MFVIMAMYWVTLIEKHFFYKNSIFQVFADFYNI